MAETTNTPSPAREDEKTEAAVLVHLLALHPIQLALAELVREISGSRPDFAAIDAVDRAVDRLDAVGLLHRNGEMVVPSRAALRFYELFD
ncbi:MAG TPA: hypothetical protein VFN89_09270 [Solirubrobacterales bacterium]|nr:hypothetical protein [Solirubrobacterales bacterium]